MKIYRVYEHGSADKLILENAPSPQPGPGEVIIRQRAVGLNYSDVQARTGGSIYTGAPLPLTPGIEAVGEIISVGAGVSQFKPGDLVGYSDFLGAYAEERTVPEASLFAIPPGLPPEEAVGFLTCGITAYVLAYQVRPGLNSEHTALVHAATGNVNMLMIQMLKLLGVRVIASVSSAEKAAVAREVGADDTIIHTTAHVAEEARALTSGRGVDIVFDGIGQATFEASLATLAPRGYHVMYGETSGPPPAVSPVDFGRRGSLFLTRMYLFHYITSAEKRRKVMSTVFDLVQSGQLASPHRKTFPFDQAVAAHSAFQDRNNIGKITLIL